MTMPSGETEEMHKKALIEFESTLNMFPSEMKQEYQEAKNICPLLTEKESDPISFLRRENFNALAAVLRFVMYWRTRKEQFAERFSHTMTLGPEGALKDEEIELFATGYLTLLPPDAEGSPVIFFDSERQSSLPPVKTFVRHLFYLSQAASANPSAQKQGLVYIFVANEELLLQLNEICKEPIEILKKSLPMKLKKLYFIPGYGLSSPESSIPQAIEAASLGDDAVPVICEDQNKLLSKLESFGFSPEDLPTKIPGGKWNWSRFSKWLVSNGHKDGGRPPSLSSSVKKSDFNPEALSPSRNSPALSPFPELPTEVLDHIPREEVIDYLEAKMRVPVIVDHESPFSRFLASENNNTLAAARRLAAYWRERRECYGERG